LETWQPLVDLLILLAGALVLGTLAERLRQHAIVGYILAGALVGPNGLNLVESREHVALIAELGVSLLLFSIGLEFSLKRLIGLGRIALIGGTLQVVLTTAVGAGIGTLLGWPASAAVALGFMLALSSTACVLRLLMDRAEVDAVHGRNAVGILLLQDIAIVPIMLIIAAMAGEGGFVGALWSVGEAILFGALLVAAFYLFFNFLAPRLMNLRQWSKNRELPILLAIVMAIGAAVAAHWLHLSPALGAFIAGILLAISPFAVQIRSDVSSLRTLFVTLFFASVGMLGNPAWTAANWYLVLAVVAMIVVGKALVIWLVLALFRVPLGLSLATGVVLAQVGEFSFVLASESLAGGLISDETFKLVISSTIITLFLTPYLVNTAPALARWIERHRRPRPKPTTGLAAEGAKTADEESRLCLLLVGFGPAGQRVSEALASTHRKQITVLDVNPRNVRAAERYGLHAMIGDATHTEVLDHAGVHHADVVVITAPDVVTVRQVIHLVRRMNPAARIIARARYHVFRWELHIAGAEIVVDEEEQVGLRLAAEARRMIRGEAARPRPAPAPAPPEPA